MQYFYIIIQTEKWFELDEVETNIRYNAKIHINISKYSIENKSKIPEKINNNYTNISNISNIGNYQNINNFATKSSENSPRLLMLNNKLAYKTPKAPIITNSIRENSEFFNLAKSIPEHNV